MKDEGRLPDPGETLDAPVYESPKPRRRVYACVIVSIATLAVLAGAAALVFSRRHKPSEVLGTRCLLNDARLACENFRLEHGQYPWPKPPAVTRALAADPVADVAIRGQQVYAEVRGHSGATINTAQDYLGDVRKTFLKNGALVDSWGREIRFRVNFSGLQAVIWSCGPNGIDETNDGDSPDPAKYPKGYYWFGKGDTGDDITNL